MKLSHVRSNQVVVQAMVLGESICYNVVFHLSISPPLLDCYHPYVTNNWTSPENERSVMKGYMRLDTIIPSPNLHTGATRVFHEG